MDYVRGPLDAYDMLRLLLEHCFSWFLSIVVPSLDLKADHSDQVLLERGALNTSRDRPAYVIVFMLVPRSSV